MGTGGLENLSIAGLGIVIAENDSLDYILLTDLETTSHLYIGDNPKLKYITSMNHLRNLGKMAIYRNTSLSNYCNLRSFYTSGITIESHRLFGNKYNPSISQLASTSYCSN